MGEASGWNVPEDWMSALRRRAAAEVMQDSRRSLPARAADSERLIHEFRIELEMQNAELLAARDELEAARSRLGDLFESAPVAYFVLDRGCIIEAVNRAGAALLGFDRAKLCGAHFAAFVARADTEAFGDCIHRAFVSRESVACELGMSGAGLKPLHVRLEARAEASCERCRVVVLDHTARKAAEDALKAAAAELEDIYQNAPCGYQTLDARGCIGRINDTALAWLGFERDELLGKMLFYDLLARPHRRDFAAAFAQLRHTGELHNRRWELRCKDGRLLPVLANATMQRGGAASSRWTLIDLTAEGPSAHAERRSAGDKPAPRGAAPGAPGRAKRAV